MTLTRAKLTPWLFLTPALVLIGIFILYPILSVVYYSFTDYTIATPPEWTGLDNYRKLVGDPTFWLAFSHSIIYLLGITRENKARMWAQHNRNFKFFDAPVGLFFSFHRDLERGTWLDMGMFLQSVMLAARGQGLHTCPQAAWVEYPETVTAVLGLAPEYQFVCGMCLGYEDATAPENALVSERERCDAFAEFRGF